MSKIETIEPVQVIKSSLTIQATSIEEAKQKIAEAMDAEEIAPGIYQPGNAFQEKFRDMLYTVLVEHGITPKWTPKKKI